MNAWTTETSESTFERDVIDRSRQVPVVVDFWAPWCGPCQVLGPLLERLAEEHAGGFILAKVNVDENPQLAGAFGVRGIPMVLGVRDASVVAEFVGAQPEAAVREFLSRLLPSEADLLAREGEAQAASGAIESAEATFRRALDMEARCPRALYGLATLLANQKKDADALALLERLPPDSPFQADADRLTAQLRIRQAGGGDTAALEATVVRDPNDLEARFALAQAQAASGQHGEALQNYLEIVKRNRAFRDDAARKAMIDIFDVLGSGNETTERYRSELAKVLFS